jgi:hypothetical protein
MKQAPNLWKLKELANHIKEGPKESDDFENWRPARPLGFYSLKSRLKIAWKVFIGKADAVTWEWDEGNK